MLGGAVTPPNFIKKSMGFIYKITSPSNKVYVGKTYDLKKRISSHKSSSKRGKNILLHNSIRKYGWDSHKLEVIEECHDDVMNDREIFWIAELKTYCYDYKSGLNMTKGADGQRSTWMHKTELRKMYSEKFSGEGNPFYGKKHTEESRKIISEKAIIRNKKSGWRIPEWGAEKGRNIVRRPVLCYGIDGVFISEYISLTEAAKTLNVNISSVTDSLRSDTWVSSKYFFRYKTENYPLQIDVPKVTHKSVKRVVCLLDDNLEVIAEFESAQEASDFFGIPKTTINRAAQYNNLNPIKLGHIFCYKDEYLEEYKLVS